MRFLSLPAFAGLAAALLVAASSGEAEPGAKEPSPAVVATEVPSSRGPALADVPGSRLVLLEPDGRRRVLTPGFAAACDPAADASAKRLLFSGAKTAAEPWQVWELDLGSGVVRQLTEGPRAARQPVYLPDGSVVYTVEGDLYRLAPDRASTVRLTFSQGRISRPVVLPDGRLLVLLGEGSGGRHPATLQPDGTWLTPWRSSRAAGVAGAVPAGGEQLVLTVPAGEGRATLALASLADPFAATRPFGPEKGWELRDPVPLPGGDLLVAARRGHRAPFSLGRLAMVPGAVPRPVVAVKGSQLLQPVPLVAREPYPLLPSIVKPAMTTGTLLIFDVARTDDPALSALDRRRIAGLRVESLAGGTTATLGKVVPAADGSLFLEVPADTPLRLTLVDGSGEALVSTSTPIWVRPNERHACLGCHVSSRYAPPNRRPLALLAEHPTPVGRAGGGAP